MKISVIIPCYNCVNFLDTTVSNVRLSGIGEYEILLVDDGSTDGTGALCDALCAKYPELRCIHQPNAGVSAARNRGIDEAHGDYLWFVDSDDTVDPDSLTYAAGIAAQQQPDMLIFGMSFDYYHRGRIYRREKLTPPFEGILTTEQLKMRFQEFYSCNALTPVWNKLFRRELLVSSGVRFHEDMILMEDFLFVLELLPFCRSIYSLPEAIYHYRQAENEKNAYRRLQRIDDIAKYMRPFESSMEMLGIAAEKSAALYEMLLRQKLYYAPLKEVQEILAKHAYSKYAFLQIGQPLEIYLHNRKTQIRHRLAVAVKSTYLYQRYFAGAFQ